jgi:hypothetical protein
MARTHWGRFGAVLATGLLVAACDKADDALGLVPDTGIIDQIKNGGVAKGVVKDIYGNPVEGAEILVYTYSQNLDHFYRPEEVPNPDDFKDPTTYKVKLDIGQLVNDGNPETEIKGTTDADGKPSSSSGLPALDGIIVVAKQERLRGGHRRRGRPRTATISIDSVLKPTRPSTTPS